MPRNISFALTTEQFKNKTKTVTRRLGWQFLKDGDVLMGCKKCMGLKPGEKIERLGKIRVISATREKLSDLLIDGAYGDDEAKKEGFPQMTGENFVNFFIQEMKCSQDVELTRIEYEYLID